MSRDGLSKNEFIREKIKDKPLNKKKFFFKLLCSAAYGLAFAAIASLVFALALPWAWNRALESDAAEPKEDVSDVKGDESTPDDSLNENEPSLPSIDNTQPGQFSIADYQEMQNQLYVIGNVANKSIVTVTSVVDDFDIFNNPYETQGQGSGVVIAKKDDEFLILTEQRVIRNAKEIRVTFIDDTTALATVKKSDYNTGLTVLSVDAQQILEVTKAAVTEAVFGNSNMVQNGTMVIALGSPLGTNYSILTGNITSKNNTITTEDHNYSVFTTDIVGSEDGSGILINVQGEVVGIVMQEYSASSTQNTLTAVAISDLAPMIDMLCKGEDIPYLGIHVSTVTDKIAETYDIPKGVYIRSVSMDSPAMEAGLQSGDVIVRLGGANVSTESAYGNKVLELDPDSIAKVKIKRRGAGGYMDLTIEVKVGVLLE